MATNTHTLHCCALGACVVLASCAAPQLSPVHSVAGEIASRTGVNPAWGGDASTAAPTSATIRADAATPLPTPLDEGHAVALALNASPEIARLLAESAALRAEALEDATPMNPVLNFTSGVPLTPGAIVPIFAMVMVQLDELWKQPIRSDIARDSYEAALLSLASEAVALATKARTLWHEIALLEAQADSAAVTRDLTEQLLAWQRERFAVGEADGEMVAKARMESAEAHHTDERTRQLLSESRLSLMGVLGRAEAPEDWRVGAEDPASARALHGEIASEAAALREMAQLRLDVRAANARMKAAQSRWILAQRSRVGKIEIGAGWERDMEDMSAAGVAALVELPIFNDGSHRIAKAAAEYEVAAIAAETTRQTALIELRTALAKARATQAMHGVGVDSTLAPASESVTRAQAALEAGEGARRDVASAERGFHQASMVVNDLERDRRRARLDLVRATGFLSAEVSP